MKICAIICEFNPFHNGHKYILERARAISACDALICIMSGQFTQRGEMCRTDKYLRAGHAVSCGADAVIELPAPFAVAPAEIFAKGAVKLLSMIDGDLTLAFGCESGQKQDFLSAAEILNAESVTFKDELSARLSQGESYITSYSAAFERCGGDKSLILSPNNILGVEYVKAILTLKKNVDIIPVKRKGCGFGDITLSNDYSSASAIRAHSSDSRILSNMPEQSYRDFISVPDCTARYERLASDFLFLCDAENLKRVYGCSEGLENRLKKLAESNFGEYGKIVEQACSKRYTKTRVERILCANLLGVYSDRTQKFLTADLSHRVLAVAKSAADRVLPIFKTGIDSGLNSECYKITSESYRLWRYLNPLSPFNNPNEKMILL